MYTLGRLIIQVDEILAVIENLKVAMRHASPATVNALRQNKEQLESIVEYIMDQDITSNVDIESLLKSNRKCLRDCMENSYSSKKPYMERSRDYT
jgi:hypothetical protein